MLRTLYSKLIAVLFLLICLIGFVFLLLVRFSSEMYQQEVSQKLNTTLAQNIVKEQLLLQGGRINEGALQEIFHMLMVINPSIEVYLLDRGGRILAFSAPPERVKRLAVDLAPIQQFIAGGTGLPLLGDDPRDAQRRKVFSAAPVPAEGPLEGYLYVILGGEALDSVAAMLRESEILRVSLWGLAAGLLVALLAGLILFAMLTGRLRRLAQIMGRYTGGAAELRYPVRGSDEIEQLGGRFNAMAERIEQQLQALKNTDALRRELVANVSHDLRTPLATLHGYLETLLLKHEGLSAEERARYLQIAVAHSERLGKLVSELFELATLDAYEQLLNSEPFSLGELIQDVAQKFQLSAEQQGITIRTDFGQHIPFAYGDVGMMQRVLENLIDNALRHTPSGGEVALVLRADRGGIRVEVCDTGSGIPPEDLPRIFDRFYRLQKSRQEGGRHAGLGLAIAKRILALHGSSIEVRSEKDRGTTFSFCIPTRAAS